MEEVVTAPVLRLHLQNWSMYMYSWSWKVCPNLCSRKWLTPTLDVLTITIEIDLWLNIIKVSSYQSWFWLHELKFNLFIFPSKYLTFQFNAMIQFLITSGFWLVTTRLREFDTSSKKKWRWQKHKFSNEKQQ